MIQRITLLCLVMVSLALLPAVGQARVPGREILVATVDGLVRALFEQHPEELDGAKPTFTANDVIIIAPGIYDLGSSSINVTRPGVVIRSSGGAEATIIKSTRAAFTIKGDDVTVQGLTISGGEVGIEITDARRAKVLENIVYDARIGVRVARSNDVLISENKIAFNDVGIELDGATQVSIQLNAIRENSVGIKVLRNSCSVRVIENNIARNETAIDASETSCAVYACDNWWGESGDRPPVKGPVEFCPIRIIPPWPIDLPCVIIESLIADKTDIAIGDTVTFTYKIRNICDKADTQELTVTIKDGLGNVVNQFSHQITINQGASLEGNFSFIFTMPTMPGEYTITATLTSGSTQSLQILIIVFEECLPYALDLNKNRKIDDPEIIQAIDIWVREANVPFCYFPPVKISDTMIVHLIDLWIRQQLI